MAIDEWIEVESTSLFPSNEITLCYWINRNGFEINELENYISKEGSFQSYLLGSSKKFESGLYTNINGQVTRREMLQLRI